MDSIMNDKQKEVLEAELKREAKTIQELTQVYEQAAKDCSDRIRELSMRTDLENIQTIIFQKQYQEALKDQIEGVLNQLHSNEFTTISEYLAKCYEDGYVGTMYDLFGQGIPILAPMNQKMIVDAIQNETKLKTSLYKELGEDVNKLKKAIRAELSRGIANDSTWNEIALKMAGNFKHTPFATAYNRSITIARTEGHRVQIKSAYDAQKVAKSKGADILKQWCSTLDGHTRPHHRELDGQIREVDDYFEVGGFQVEAPSMFGDPAEDCNCRCALLQRARWALDEDELAELEERADFYGLDKSDSFEEFRQKYLKIPEEGADSGSVRSDVQMISKDAETLENTGKNGIIKVTKTISGHEGTPKIAEPNAVIDHVNSDEKVDARSFHDSNGIKVKDIHTTDHGNPKWHKYGEHGEHAHDYEWNDDGSLKNKTSREMTKQERKENDDIL